MYPAFRCPIYNIRRKRNGLNDFRIEINLNETQKQNKDCPGFAARSSKHHLIVQSMLQIQTQNLMKILIIASRLREELLSGFVGQALLAPAGIGAIGKIQNL